MQRLTKTKLFIDGGDPAETARATAELNAAGYYGLDGQTTNPSLVAKNPDIAARIVRGEKLTSAELIAKYEEIIRGIEKNAAGDISIEVYADAHTTADAMIAQAREFALWTSSAVIKLPITPEGLKAAEQLKEEMPLNLTLCFSQAQAAAVYGATRGARYTVYVSPFIGRLDDRGENGLELVAHLMRMFAAGDGHVEVLTASVRGVDHILGAFKLQTHALTLPYEKAFKPWAQTHFSLPDDTYQYPAVGKQIAYQPLDLNSPWQSLDIHHELTDVGLQKFADDWNSLLAARSTG